MVRLGSPDNIEDFFMTDDSELIFNLHQALSIKLKSIAIFTKNVLS